MEQDLFRYFLRINFKNVQVSNNEADEIGKAFADYLNGKCTPEQQKNFMPESAIQVIADKEHPFRMNGFHPALVMHFTDFVDEIKKITAASLSNGR